MAEPRLTDAVTLRHFGAVGRLDVLEKRLTTFPAPRWTLAVYEEIRAFADDEACSEILEAQFLGLPAEVDFSLLRDVFLTRRALTEDDSDPLANLGEAETICLADSLNGTFITDDAAAFDHAERRLGNNRVMDTVDLFREAVATSDISAADAKLIADSIRNIGRHLRAGHPPTLTEDYFFWPE